VQNKGEIEKLVEEGEKGEKDINVPEKKSRKLEERMRNRGKNETEMQDKEN
jgi:hypothetical protein